MSSVRSACVALALLIPALIAAEKNRDWQMGQVVASKTADTRIHNIAGPDKTYIVRGQVGGPDNALDVGAAVRFAVQGTTMYVSIEGIEYKLSILGATVKSSVSPAPAAAASAPAPPAAPPVTVPQSTPQPAAPPAPSPAPKAAAAPIPAPAPKPNPPARNAQATLDNDAVVKMVVGGLKDDTVVSVIQARPGKYNLAPDAIAGLKAAGVPQTVIDAMSAKMRP